MNFFSQLRQSLSSGPIALATVVATRGSTPRSAGARQFLTSAGKTVGSIGGGAAEARTLALAVETLADGQPRSFEADLRGRPENIREGVCGGMMTIWIIRLEPERDLPIVTAAENSLKAGRPLILATRLESLPPLAIAPPTIPGAAREYVETIAPAPRLLICGAGHIGRALARVAAELEFDVLVHDERSEWLDGEAFPRPCTFESDLPAAVSALGGWQGGRFAVLVTRGYPQDVAALNALLQGPQIDYVGLLGSRTRVATVMAELDPPGVAAWPSRVLHAPVGLEIGAQTPEEIAISIAAEMVRCRRETGA